jgi:hypothetical protein
MPIKPRRSVRLNLESLEERDVPSSSISGVVFNDVNNNGRQDAGEAALASVLVTLTGHDNQNNAVNLTQTTDVNGNFNFTNVAAGVYSLTETPASGYINGLTTAGSQGGSAAIGSISNIVLPDGVADTGNYLGELAQSASWTSSQFTFNRGGIHPGSTIWFSSVFGATGLGNGTVTLQFNQQTISYQLDGSTVTLAVPGSIVTISPTATTASTAFDDSTNTWLTTVPTKLGGYKFLGGFAMPVSNSLPGQVNVTWQGQLISDTPGVAVNWQWAAAVYTTFGTDYNSLNVKPVDAGYPSQFPSADHVGTPEAFTPYLTNGATSQGGTNYAGEHSGAVSVNPIVPASLSGYVINQFSGTGLGRVTIELEDSAGDVLSTTTTIAGGSYSFTNLQPGTYQLVAVGTRNLIGTGEQVGTVAGQSLGSDLGNLTLGNISLASGDVGINYDFFMSQGG